MYNHTPDRYLCPFCLLVQGIENEGAFSVQSDIIYQDGSVTALIGSHQWPNNHGNVLIVPNEHFENIYELPVDYAIDIHRVARLVAIAMKLAYRCAGVSTRQHNEPSGSQDVWHYHLHVTPRYRDDDFYTTRRELMAVAKRAMHAEKIRRGLAGALVSGVALTSRGSI
jgi:histidine triad (HIT) family protein